MKYIYYILGIIVLITVLTAFQFKKIKVDLHEPALIINDRIISDVELEKMVSSWSQSYHMVGVIDAIVTNQLLIQEGVKQGINEEESFRESIQGYYEQSLVKILIDRKFGSFNPEIPEGSIQHYVDMSGKLIHFTKHTFDSIDDALKGKAKQTETLTKNFQDMSDSLKYVFLELNPGQISEPVEFSDEIATYTLNSLSPSEIPPETDLTLIQDFLVHQRKQALFNDWLSGLKKDAKIQVLTHKFK
ncbi:MAG: hypothetical protein V1793_16815 [Pseudomonadota bacterium]